MKLKNYDSEESDHPHSLNDFLTEDFRMLITGRSGCGKTNTLMNILREPLVPYDKIYLYSRNNQQNKIQDLLKLMEMVSQKVGYDVLVAREEDEIMETTEYPNDNRKVVVFDDLMNAPQAVQNKIASHFTDGRHHKISPIYLSQSYYDVPKKLRLNCSHMILYPPDNKNHLDLIAKENMIDPALFDKLGPYEFLFLDKGKKSVTKNFDESV